MKKKTGPNEAWTLCEVQAKYHLNHDLNRTYMSDIGKEGQQIGKEGQQSGVIAKLPSFKHPQLCTNFKVMKIFQHKQGGSPMSTTICGLCLKNM
jgi:hypothetical protein